MATDTKILHSGEDGSFSIKSASQSDIQKVDIVDVDLVITMKDGTRFVLAGAGLDAMSEHPPVVHFANGSATVSDLFAEVGVAASLNVDLDMPSSLEGAEVSQNEYSTVEEQQEAEEQEQQQQQQNESQSAAFTTNTEASVEKLVEEVKRIEENLHKSDYDYVPPQQFELPSAPFAAAPGLPPPVSLTPFVSLFMGNVVGTQTDTTTIPGRTLIYGGGGAVGTDSAALLGPRDPLQFSAATINGTSGNDTIYANGPLVGNPDPSVSTNNNAKEFLLNVAGYFTTLNDVTITGVPAGVSIAGAIDNGGGSWTLPSASVIDGIPFSIVYDMDAWRGGSDTFEISVEVSGNTTRGLDFSTIQTFRFQYMDVTSTDQVTDPSLVYVSGGIAKQVYVLPTLSQPAIINSGEGDDIIYAGRSNDTITSGDGNNEIYAGQGNDTVTVGDGDNDIDLGLGTDILIAGNGQNNIIGGAGSDTITVGSGNNIVDLGGGGNTFTAGNGNNTVSGADGNNVIQTGTGNDDFTFGDGNNQINAGGGDNTFDLGGGNNIVTATSGNDTLTAGDGDNNINLGGGNDSIAVGDGDNLLVGGDGDDILIAGNGTNVFRPGIGTNTVTGGAGVNTVDYSDVTTTGINASLASGTVTGTGLLDTLTNIQNVVGTTLADVIVGNSGANILSGGAGDDTLTGGGGNDTFYGGLGNDTITGGTGDDTVYAGDGDNIVYTGTAGADRIYGGSGNNTFYAQHAGVYYDGTNGADLATGQVNTVDYSAGSAAITVNLLTGIGSGGLAAGDTYAFTPTNGFNSINAVIGGSGADTLTGSNADDYLDGGSGSDTLTGGLGNNILVGGLGTNTFKGGLGNDTFVGNTGTDYLHYQTSGAGIVANFDAVSRSFVNSLGVTVTIAAYSGGNKQVTAADENSFSNGDTYAVMSGTDTGIDYVYGSDKGDIIFAGDTRLIIVSGAGSDYFYGGVGADFYYGSAGQDRLIGGAGNDTFYADTTRAIVAYLDGTADINNNGIADHIDRGISSLTENGVTYAGFVNGYSSGFVLLQEFDWLLGHTGSDTLVGDDNANRIHGRGGSNLLYGMGGDDTIYSAEGSNTIDGGSGTDTVDFANAWQPLSGLTTGVQVFLGDSTFYGASDKTHFWGSGFSIYQSRTGGGPYLYSTITNVENILGSDYNDVLYGNGSANTITGGSGADIIAGNGGADTLVGGAGNDTFLVKATDLSSVIVFNGGTGSSSIDTVKTNGYNLTAGSINTNQFISIEVFDNRNGVGGDTYSLNATDIRNMADNGNSSNVNLRLDSGDTFNPTVGAGTGALSASIASSTATNTIYHFYSGAGQTGSVVAIVDVYKGTA